MTMIRLKWLRSMALAELLLLYCLLGTGGSAFGYVAQEEQPAEDGWSESLDDALKDAAIAGKPVLVKFEAEWCGPCKTLAKEFRKPGFAPISDASLLVRIDVDRQPEVAQQYAIESIPTVLLIDSNGQVVADKVGMADIDAWTKWFDETVEGTEFEMPDVLAATDAPTRTEIKDLIGYLGDSDPALRQIAMDRLAAFPTKSRATLVKSLQGVGKLAQKLSVLEILHRWNAPIEDLDPWVETAFTAERLAPLNEWEQTPLEQLEDTLTELTEEDIRAANEEIDRLLSARRIRASLSRLTRCGSALLPEVYRRLEVAESDEQTSRLTALRYWLTASNELRLGWFGGLVELASIDAESRRTAANVLIERVTIDDQALLLELFADSDPLVRELSLKGLTTIGADKTDEILAGLLEDPDKNVRAAVLKQFAEAEATHMAKHVATYLETETDGNLIVHALRFMRTSSGDKAALAVLNFSQHESWQVRAEVAEALAEIDVDDLSAGTMTLRSEAVVKLLEDEDGFVVSRAVKALPDKPSRQAIAKLTDIAFERPVVAKEIADWMAERANYHSEKKGLIVPSLQRFLEHELADVRVAGVKALVNIDDGNLQDGELSKLFDDTDSTVRVAALNAMLQKFNSQRDRVNEDIDGVGSVEFDPNRRRRGRGGSIVGWALGGMFGRAKRAEPEGGLVVGEDVDSPDKSTEAENELGDEANSEQAEKEGGEEEAPEEASDEEDVEEPLQLPDLATEEWLGKWRTGAVSTELDESIAKLESLAEADVPAERAAALSCLVVLGDQTTALSALEELVGKNSEQAKYLSSVLSWLPFENRTQLFQELADRTESDSEFGMLINHYSYVRNPAATDVLWKFADHRLNRVDTWRRAYLRACFGNNVRYYTNVSNENINQDLLDSVGQTIVAQADQGSAKKQALALLLLQQLDLEKAKLVAQQVRDSDADAQTRDLALRVLLMPPRTDDSDMLSDQPPEDNLGEAVNYLKTEDSHQYKTVLRYLALGKESLADSEEFPEYSLRSFHSYSYYSSSNDEVKVRIPKPPEGLTTELLSEVSVEQDAEAKAYVTYFRSLLEQEVDLDALIDYWEAELGSEAVAKLVYRAIASQNEDDAIPVVEHIYEELQGETDTSLAADIYWTIRVMDGKNALRLRKRIRKEVGMSDLRNY